MILEEFLSNDAFVMVNKALAKKIWLSEAFLLQEFISLRKRFKQDEFYISQKEIEENIWITVKTQSRYIKKLVELGLISYKKKWIPCKNRYSINDEKVIQVIQNEKTSSPKLENKYGQNVHTGIDKMSEQEKTKSLDYSNNKKEEIKKEDNKKEENNSTTLNKISNEILIEEKKEYWNIEINELIKTLKKEAEKIWIAYDPTDERMFAKHILTAKEFWKLADRYGISRVQFAVWIMNASVQINYRKGACSWPKKIYQNTAEVFNEAIRQKQKEEKNKIASF